MMRDEQSPEDGYELPFHSHEDQVNAACCFKLPKPLKPSTVTIQLEELLPAVASTSMSRRLESWMLGFRP